MLPGLSNSKAGDEQAVIELADGSSVIVARDGDTVLLAIDQGPDRDGIMARLPMPAAAWLSGHLAVASGVVLEGKR